MNIYDIHYIYVNIYDIQHITYYICVYYIYDIHSISI